MSIRDQWNWWLLGQQCPHNDIEIIGQALETEYNSIWDALVALRHDRKSPTARAVLREYNRIEPEYELYRTFIHNNWRIPDIGDETFCACMDHAEFAMYVTAPNTCEHEFFVRYNDLPANIVNARWLDMLTYAIDNHIF